MIARAALGAGLLLAAGFALLCIAEYSRIDK